MSTLTKGKIGEQDIQHWDGTTNRTFTRATSTGGKAVLNKVGTEVDVLIVFGNGTEYTKSTIQSALNAIGTTNTCRLVLRPGTWSIDENVTIPSNITTVIPAGCVLDVDSGITITFNGPVESDAHDWQTGSGTFTLGSPTEMTIRNADMQFKGDARILRFNDTGTSGAEWGVRSDGGNFEICENTGTEASPTWTARSTITSTDAGEALTINMRGERNITKMWFYLDTAPTGWTIDETPADALLCVKGGSNAYNTAGGAQAGTWTQPNHLHTTGDVTLTTAQIPDHTHGVNGNPGGGGSGTYRALSGDSNTVSEGSTLGMQESAGGSAHNHGNTGNSATAATWRPLAQIGIICTLS